MKMLFTLSILFLTQIGFAVPPDVVVTGPGPGQNSYLFIEDGIVYKANCENYSVVTDLSSCKSKTKEILGSKEQLKEEFINYSSRRSGVRYKDTQKVKEEIKKFEAFKKAHGDPDLPITKDPSLDAFKYNRYKYYLEELPKYEREADEGLKAIGEGKLLNTNLFNEKLSTTNEDQSNFIKTISNNKDFSRQIRYSREDELMQQMEIASNWKTEGSSQFDFYNCKVFLQKKKKSNYLSMTLTSKDDSSQKISEKVEFYNVSPNGKYPDTKKDSREYLSARSLRREGPHFCFKYLNRNTDEKAIVNSNRENNKEIKESTHSTKSSESSQVKDE